MGREVLTDYKKNFQKFAEALGDYENISTTDLANGYCDADEALKATKDETLKKQYEIKRSQYYSALMLRYWYKIFEYAKSCASARVEIEDFVSWMDDSFYWAFRYRAWRTPYKYDFTKDKYRLDENGEKIPEPLYGDPNGPDKIFNQCFSSTRGRQYQHTNKEVRKINWTSSSIDALEESVGDHASILGTEEETPYYKEIVQNLLEKSKIMEALVVDSILRCDIWDETQEKTYRPVMVFDPETNKPVRDENDEIVYTQEEYCKVTRQLNIKKLVKHIKYLSTDFARRFVKYYDLKGEVEEKFLTKVHSITPNGLNQTVKRTLYNLRQNRDILSLLEN